jgi:C-terminal processing protease CtpA/Prc
MKKRHIFIGLMFAMFLLDGCSNNSGKVENLRTLAKAYGYVKYFHPSDEASQIDWAKFSIYAADKIEKCETEEEVVTTLNKLFSPIAPSVRFLISKTKPGYNIKTITPDNLAGYRLTYWEHQGVSIGGMTMKGVYKSVRVNRDVKNDGEKIFDYHPEIGSVITKNIGNNIYCQVPLVLYCNDKSTYPMADTVSFKNLETALSRFDLNIENFSQKTGKINGYNVFQHLYPYFHVVNKSDYLVENLSLRTGNVINVYNVFQHFYPYFDVVDVNWDKELTKALNRCFTDKTPKDHLITLQKFTAPLKDGHINVNCNTLGSAALPISWEWIENKLVITHLFKENSKLNVGDIVTHIDGVSSEKYFEEINSRISAGTKGWLNFRAEMMSLQGDKGSAMKLTINDKSIDIQLDNYPYNSRWSLKKDKRRYMQIENNIWYLNMDMIEMDTINKLLPALEKCKAIICDARGYPKGNQDFITHLMNKDDTTSSWMQIPKIVYPDHENITGYDKFNWMQIMKAKKPYLGDKKVVYIIDGSAISYAESCLGYIEGYKLATIVGQPSAGTNGNVNPFWLPGGYTIYWTGMKVVKHNGSQQHGIGILPNVYVTKTIKGIKEDRDEFLEKAIEIAKQK